MPGQSLPSVDADIDVLRIQFDRPGVPAGPLGGNQDRAAAGERVEDDPLAMAAVADRVGDQADRLDGRVQGQELALAAAIDARVRPHVGAVAAVLAELEVVDVRRVALLEDIDQLVLAAVEGAHAGVVLVPDAQLREDRRAGCGGKELGHMAPVHEEVADRPVRATAWMGHAGLPRKFVN